MTRTATKPGRAKRALDATPWEELSSSADLPSKKSIKKSKSGSNDATTGNKVQIIKEMKRVRKSESRRLKRMHFRYSDKTCFNCRKKGHTLADCPRSNKDVQGTGVCFKCGSMNHTSKTCKVKGKGKGEYPYATCFICKEVGHISRDCPQNDRGLYPNGGCCLECGSVKHLRKDCPEKQKKQGIASITLPTISNTESADIDVAVDDPIPEKLVKNSKTKLNKRKTKVVSMK